MSIWSVKHKNTGQIIAEFSANVTVYGFTLEPESIIIYEDTDIPNEMKALMRAGLSSENIIGIFLELRTPQFSASDENDMFMMKALKLSKEALQRGRLNIHNKFLALLSYYQSDSDDIIVSPTKIQKYYFGLWEKGFTELYVLHPYS